MKVEISGQEVAKLRAKVIDQLTKENESLKKKLKSAQGQVSNAKGRYESLKRQMDLTKDRRDRIKKLAQELVDEMESAAWIDLDREFY